MYGLPKTHKKSTPLRPILSMTGLSYHELGKWLAGLLQPVFLIFFFLPILHSRESKLYRYILDGASALTWELQFQSCQGHLSST